MLTTIIILIAAVIYLMYRKYKKTEKELEDDVDYTDQLGIESYLGGLDENKEERNTLVRETKKEENM